MKTTRKGWVKLTPREVAYIYGDSDNLSKYRFKNYYLHQTINNSYAMVSEIKLLPYIILFLPLAAIEFFRCMWCCGLCKFRLPKREMFTSSIYRKSTSTTYPISVMNKRMEKVYNN